MALKRRERKKSLRLANLVSSTRVLERLEARNLLAGDLVGHWRAQDLVGSVDDGSVVSAWHDGTSQIAASATGTPTFVQQAINGRSALRFNASDGVDRFFVEPAASPMSNAEDFSIAVTFRTDSNSLEGGTGNWFQNTGLVDGSNLGFAPDWGMSINPAGQIAAGMGSGFGLPISNAYSNVSGLNDGQLHTAVFTRQQGLISIYVDGGAQGQTNGTATGPRSPSLGISIGSLLPGNRGFTGEIAEVRIYNGQLSASEVTQLQSELTTYYNNTQPIANNDSYTATEDSQLVVVMPTLLANDVDADGDALTAQLVRDAEHGTVVVNADGTFVYQPNEDFFGVDTFTYTASDFRPSNVATVQVQVQPVNDAARTQDDGYFGDVGQVIEITAAAGVLSNDVDVEGSPLTASIVTQPSSGVVDFRPDGSFRYTPNAGFAGTDQFTYVASDGIVNSAATTVSLFVGSSPLRINEFMAGNSAGLTTRVRATAADPFSGTPITPDWIELYNASTSAIDIGGFYLTDDADEPQKWQIPVGTTIAANGFLLFYASQRDIRDPSLDEDGILHTNFSLNLEGEYLAIRSATGDVLHEYSRRYPRQVAGVSYGLQDQARVGYLLEATPGAANSGAYLGAVSDTRFSVDRGFFDAPFEVTIATSTEGAQIRYTFDGSAPAADHGFVYSGPIAINGTTTLRAAAFKDGYLTRDVDTQTYLFADQVIQQSTAPTSGPDGTVQFPSRWRSLPADYEMDPEVTGDPLYAGQMKDALLALPSLSLTLDQDDIFGNSGLYSTPLSDAEKPASAEMIYPDGSVGFQIDAGARMQGGASRNTEHKKHSMSLRFREAYGNGELDFPLFEGSPVTQFNSIHLRARYNNSWIHWDQGQRNRGSMIREAWMRDSMLAAGDVAAGHGQFVHLYLNGLYWGVYEMHERQDASHMAAYFGGESFEYDATNANIIVDGNNASWRDLPGIVRSGDWEAIQAALDVDNHILFNILMEYGGNQDLKADGNWRAGGGGSAQEPWRFFVWDAERVLESVTQRGTSPVADLLGFRGLLDNLLEYRVRFADEVHRLLFNDGALTPEAAADRWMARADELDVAIIAESARWGDLKQGNPLTRNKEWVAERDRLLNSYFPGRTANAVSNFRRAGLYPNTEAAEFEVNGQRQHGGPIGQGDQVTIANPNPNGTGQVYYALGGIDPRQEGGSVAPGAVLYTGGAISLGESTRVKVRVLNGEEWSAVTDTEFILEQAASAENLAITEVNYHPHDGQTRFGEPDVDGGAFEYIEVQNIGQQPINLAGVKLVQVVVDGDSEGVDFTFAAQRLLPGESVVVVRDRVAFVARYGDSVPIAAGRASVGDVEGQWAGGRLGDGGETLTILDAEGAVIRQFAYDDEGLWPDRADGVGSSLILVDVTSDPSRAVNWRASDRFGGSPGQANQVIEQNVVINELLTNSDAPAIDRIELFNRSTQSVDVSGWYLSDAAGNLWKAKLAPTPAIAPGGYLVLDENQFGFGFKGQSADDVWLVEADSQGRPVRFADGFEFGATEAGRTLGRWSNGSGRLFPQVSATWGAANSGPQLGPIVISEVHYHPNLNQGEPFEAEDFEFVEIANTGALPIDLSGWRIDKAVDFEFAAGQSIAGNSTIVVVPFDPQSALMETAFRNRYRIGPNVPLVGPFQGVLDDGGENLELYRPYALNDPDAGEVLVDRVRYDDVAPWPNSADGQGSSLQRSAPDAYGDFAASWIAQTATPGSFIVGPAKGDFNLDGVVNVVDVNSLMLAIRNQQHSFDLDGDELAQFSDLEYMIHTVLGTWFGDTTLDRVFNSSDLIEVFLVGEYEDNIPGNSTWGDGDWNGDGDFTSSDFILAFIDGGYSVDAQPASTISTAFVELEGHLDKPRSRSLFDSAVAALDGEVDESTRLPKRLEVLTRDRLFADYRADDEWRVAADDVDDELDTFTD